MSSNNPKLHVALVNLNAYIKFGEILSILLKIFSGIKLLTSVKGHTCNSRTYSRKMTGNNSKLDVVNMNAYIKNGEDLSICSRDIKRKRNSGVSQGP